MFARLFAPTFSVIAERWIAEDYVHSANPRAVTELRLRFERYVYPYIGGIRITKVKTAHLYIMLTEYKKSAPRSVQKLIQVLRRIFVYAELILPFHVEMPVSDSLNKIARCGATEGYSVLPMYEVPAFFVKAMQLTEKAVRWKTKQAAVGFWLIAYTAMRRSEVMNATWDEIDLNARVWVINGERMKCGKAHYVPLSEQAIAQLLKLQKLTKRNTGRLFDINAATVNAFVKRASAGMTVHGLRKAFSTYANESKLFSADAIELQLAHTIRGVRGVYNKAQHFDERRRLVQWYADEIDGFR